MKHALLPAVISLAIAGAGYAVPTDVTYTDGDATTRLTSGKQHDTVIGDVLNTGDSIKTGADGEVEMNQKGVTIRVNHGTVFTLMEREQKGQKSPVVSVALGSIKFRYNKLTGQEPIVRTNSAVLGVRGTDFTVFSGADGSTLIAVDSGQVTVEAEGKSVELAAAEGVEVPLGGAPGDKFTVHSDQIDYSKWNDDKLKAMLADPVAAIGTLESTLDEYIKSIAGYDTSYRASNERLKVIQEERVRIFKEKGEDEARKFMQESEFPIADQTA
ncbi:MAG TPA: FecR domain-containing protein, partial [Spirochaetia bacterium]|nr:FecR domain-containing protein [Spirochaetia bacterium]